MNLLNFLGISIGIVGTIFALDLKTFVMGMFVTSYFFISNTKVFLGR